MADILNSKNKIEKEDTIYLTKGKLIKIIIIIIIIIIIKKKKKKILNIEILLLLSL